MAYARVGGASVHGVSSSDADACSKPGCGHRGVGLLPGGVSSLGGDPFSLGVTNPWDTRIWVQPALDFTASLFPRPSAFNLHLRATAGPIVNLAWQPSLPRLYPPTPPGLLDPLVWTNVELALEPWPGCEVAAGFPDLVSLRYSW
jgi:hypothetical protein